MNRVSKKLLLIMLAVLILTGIILGLSQLNQLAPVDPVPTPRYRDWGGRLLNGNGGVQRSA